METELPEMPELEREIRKDHLNTLIAITVTILVTFMAICRLNDNNIVLQMQEIQAEKVDDWSWYQALAVRVDINLSKISDLNDSITEETNAQKKQLIQTRLQKLEDLEKRLEEKKEKVQEKAKGEKERYEKLDKIHEEYDQSEAMISIAVSMLALTSLMQKRWMYGIALLPALIGLVKGTLGILHTLPR